MIYFTETYSPQSPVFRGVKKVIVLEAGTNLSGFTNREATQYFASTKKSNPGFLPGLTRIADFFPMGRFEFRNAVNMYGRTPEPMNGSWAFSEKFDTTNHSAQDDSRGYYLFSTADRILYLFPKNYAAFCENEVAGTTWKQKIESDFGINKPDFNRYLKKIENKNNPAVAEILKLRGER